VNSVIPAPVLVPTEALLAHQMVFNGVALVLALLHLTLFAFEPRQHANLYCGLFVASFGAVIHANFATILDPQAIWAARIFPVAIAVAVAMWLRTLHTVFAVQRPWFRRILVPVAAIFGLWGALQPARFHYGLLALIVIASTLAAGEVGLAWNDRRPGSRVLGVGMTVFGLLVVYSALRTLDLAPDTPWSVFVPVYAGICAALTLSLFLAQNHAALSRHALALEREKQSLALARAAELELVVAARTSELRHEKGRVDELLYNILPRDTADELKATGRALPRRHEDVTVLFTDFKGFTHTVSAMPADKLVTELNDIFNRFDDIMDRHGVQKIKTIGDAYMAAGGLPGQPDDGAGRIVAAALDLIATIEERNLRSAVKWHMRLGVHTGVVVAGVVGKRRLLYDLFGDTVNIASRMESHGEPGRINLSAYSYDLVRARFACDYLGKIDVKGKGEIDMYCVRGSVA
jgi:class 3 adenylate cyclase